MNHVLWKVSALLTIMLGVEATKIELLPYTIGSLFKRSFSMLKQDKSLAESQKAILATA